MSPAFEDVPPLPVAQWVSEQLFEQAPISIAVLDPDLSVVFSNTNFVAVFGEGRGRRCYEAYKKKQEICADCAALKTFRDGISRITQARGLDCIGSKADYVVHHSPILAQGRGVSYVVNMSYDITEQRAILEQYNQLFDKVPCSLSVINRDLRITRANEQARERFGDAVGLRCYQAYKQREEPCAECPARETFADGMPHSSSQVRVSSNGSCTYHLVSTAPLPGEENGASHVVEMALDVTDVHLLSEELRQENALREQITESALDALVAVDPAGLVTVYNQAAEVLFGLPREQVLRQTRGERFLPAAFLAAIERQEQTLLLPEVEVTDAAGETIPVRLSGTVLRSEGQVVGGAAFLQDLRPLKALEREKLEHERLATVGQTVTQLAHSIKNILMGLQGGIYSVKTGCQRQLPERTAEGLEMLERNYGRINALVREFLRFSKEHRPELAPVDPDELAREVYTLYRETAARNGVALELQLTGTGERLLLDGPAIHSCLVNLVANAVDACIAAGGRDRSVLLRVAIEAQTLRFVVSDDGCGMDKETREKLFTRIFTTKGAWGSGLGLVMTKKIVEDHCGRISVDSAPGRGSRFCLVLPRKAAPQAKKRAGAGSKPKKAKQEG